MDGHGWKVRGYAMSKLLSGATDLFGLETPVKRSNERAEAAALVEVLKALRAHPAVVW